MNLRSFFFDQTGRSRPGGAYMKLRLIQKRAWKKWPLQGKLLNIDSVIQMPKMSKMTKVKVSCLFKR